MTTIAANDNELAAKIENLLILEGLKTYDSLAGHNLEVIATGMLSVIEFDYLDHRIFR